MSPRIPASRVAPPTNGHHAQEVDWTAVADWTVPAVDVADLEDACLPDGPPGGPEEDPPEANAPDPRQVADDLLQVADDLLMEGAALIAANAPMRERTACLERLIPALIPLSDIDQAQYLTAIAKVFKTSGKILTQKLNKARLDGMLAPVLDAFLTWSDALLTAYPPRACTADDLYAPLREVGQGLAALDDALARAAGQARVIGVLVALKYSQAEATRLVMAACAPPSADGADAPVVLADFYAYMPMHNYLHIPTGGIPWPADSVNAHLPLVAGMLASDWLDKYQYVVQMTWLPGAPLLIRDRVIKKGGWEDQPGAVVYNQYTPPTLVLGDAAQAGKWIDHVHRLYPTEADHIIAWLAHRVQHPDTKVNHCLVLGGGQGIGKDTLLEPVKYAVGPWNFADVSPGQIMGRFNGFLKSVILRVSEARDLGSEISRFTFYSHMKAYTVAPPDVLLVDEKNLREYTIPNLCGVILTTNHKTDGIFLPPDDRRHHVAWSECTKEDFTAAYWTDLWRWYETEGYGHVGKHLATVDLSGFNPKAPPPKTEAFYAIVQSGRAPESDALAETLDRLAAGRAQTQAMKEKRFDPTVPCPWPDALTLDEVLAWAPGDFQAWLQDRKNSRALVHRLEDVGYMMVRNRDEKRGRWTVGGRQRPIYARRELSAPDRYAAAEALVDEARPS